MYCYAKILRTKAVEVTEEYHETSTIYSHGAPGVSMHRYTWPIICTSWKIEYLLVLTDMFSNNTNTIAMNEISATEVSKNFVNPWVFSYSHPEKVVADNGVCFT